ncbi:hypothetical protein [Herminiimonas contaminans]|uniref:Uncharacterized protein n=1 Tax=Herminiimonas contaminans TaxID=1111140 RepID=A0ABS0EXS4_9BURK|nr:hypothetical protein [Herminiimonas contaminans]MBF8179650.1 hypothetical protein [Herminiimonas contaminans]
MALTPEQEAVKRASQKGQKALAELDRSTLRKLQDLYGVAMEDIRQALIAVAGSAGMIGISNMGLILMQIRSRLENVSAERNHMLDQGLTKAAEIGTTPFVTTVPPATLQEVRSEAVQYVRDFAGTDKLKLSDRIWRIDRHAQEIVEQSVRNSVMRGQGASQAASDFLARGIPVPAEIGLAQKAATATEIGKTVETHLLTGKGTPVDNAMRVMRTEINRSHTRAYQQGAAADPASVGTRFLLSPRHPRVDICDMHARANLFGLGAGVYPHGRSPLPAHPNTLSFEVIVYRDEVSAADRQGKQTVIEFLEKVPSKDRKGILGANKNEAFEAGKLTKGMVRSRWGDVRRRIGWQEDYRDTVSRRHFNQRVTFPDGVPELRIKGNRLTETQIASLTGAPDGAKIKMDPYGDGPTLRISHPFYAHDSKRSFIRTEGGGMALSNDLLMLNHKKAPRGLGLRIFTTQALQAKELGFESIEIFAARGQGMNGYHTWPQYGANAKLPKDILELLPDGLKGATDLLELVKTEAGRAFWREEGYSIECSFDLTEGSRSWQQLIKQVTAKKISLKKWTGLI